MPTKINAEIICKSLKAYFIIVTMNQKRKEGKLWLCEYLGKIRGVWRQAKAKINELIIHTISNI